jgi:cell division septation protein DedD
MRQPASQYPAGHYPADAYGARDDGYELQGDERFEEAPRRDRRLPAILLTVCVMALFAGGLWFAYVQGTRHAAVSVAGGDGVPLLRADDRPTKVKPEQPGGMPIPDQNVSLYNDKPGRPSTEKLLPSAEQPMPRPAPSPPKATAAPAPSVAPAGSPVETAPAPPQAAPPAPARPAAKAAEPKPPAQPKPAAQPKPIAAAAEASHDGKVQVRLGSLRSPDAAREEWGRLKRENADLLGSLRAVAVRTDLGEKGIYYRIEAGPFADAAAAERLCGELKRRNRGCLLAR